MRSHHRRSPAARASIAPLAALLLAALAGCASPRLEDNLETALAEHYAAHAEEEGGACPEPRIEAITKQKVLSSNAERTVLRVRYSYYDPSVAQEDRWDRLFQDDRPCTGFAERNFTLMATKLGHQVIEMGQAQPAPRQP